MQSATLSDFLALNDQLIALVQAGVPVNLGLPRNASAAAAIEKISAAVTRRVGQGATLEQALDDARSVPSLYRNLVQLALQGGDLSTALGAAERTAESFDESLHAVRSSLFYPLLVAFLAYLGLVAFCLFFVPTLSVTHYRLRLPTGSGLAVLQTLRNTLPYWAALPPMALVLVAGWSRFRSHSGAASSNAAAWLAWLPGMKQAIYEHRCANFADALASYLNADAPLSEGLRLAAGAWDDETLEAETRDLAASGTPGILEQSALAARLPPFLRWALCHSDETIGRPQALRMAANTYRESAQRRAERLRVLAPLVTCIVLGGGVTLLYGLALFIPVVQMLKGLAS